MSLSGVILKNKYRVAEKIGESQISTSYRALDLESGTDEYVVRLFRSNTLSAYKPDLVRFRNEVERISRIDHPGIVRLYDFGMQDEDMYLVSGYMQGTNLAAELAENRVTSVYDSVIILRMIAEVLQFCHSQNIIHRDLNPYNVYLTGAFESLRLTGFGVPFLKDFSKIESNFESLEIFAYVSPEIYGVIPHNVDRRCDIYSAGIMLYRMLTGVLPYKSESVSGIIHQHLAVLPVKPSKLNSRVSADLDAIVMKMMAKNPEERYDGASALIKDIDRFLGVRSPETKDPLKKRTRLINHEKKFGMVRFLYDRMESASGNIVLVSGNAGCGKTRFIEEAACYATVSGALVLYGNCQHGENREPFAPVIECFNSYLDRLKNLSEIKKEQICSAIQFIENPAALVSLNSDFIKFCPDILEVNETERSETKSIISLIDFFRAVCEFERGIVFVIEDLQWSDESTLRFIDQFSSTIYSTKIMIIASYRSSDVNGNAFFENYLERWVQSRLLFTPIEIPPLSQYNLKRYLGELLVSDYRRVSALGDYLYGVTSGNPFHLRELVRQFLEEDALFQKEGIWDLRPEKREAIRESDSVITILLRRIDSFSPEEIFVIHVASVTLRDINAQILIHLCAMEPSVVNKALENAVDAHILEHKTEPAEYSFTYNRLAEMLYNRFEERQKYHLLAAEYYEKNISQKYEKSVYTIFYHYKKAHCSDKMLEYAPLASRLSRKKTGWEDAMEYNDTEFSLLAMRGETGTARYLRCLHERGELLFLQNRIAEAKACFEQLLEMTGARRARARIYKNLALLCARSGDFIHGRNYAKKGLSLCSYRYSSVFWRFALIGDKLVADRNRKKVDHRVFFDYRLAAELYHLLVFFASQWNDRNIIRDALRAYSAAKKRFAGSKHYFVAHKDLALAFMTRGMTGRALDFLYHNYEAEKKIGNDTGCGKALQLSGHALLYSADFAAAKTAFSESLENFERIGDRFESLCSLIGYIQCEYFLSNYDICATEMPSLEEEARVIQDAYTMHLLMLLRARVFFEKGDFERALEIATRALGSATEHFLTMITCMANAEIGRIHLAQRDYDRAIDYIEAAVEGVESSSYPAWNTVYIYVLLADVYVENYRTQKFAAEGRATRRYSRIAIKRACTCALRMTKNWPAWYPEALRAMAVYHSIFTNSDRSSRYFERAASIATANKRQYQMGRIYYSYGVMLYSHGRIDIARVKLEMAFHLFNAIGSVEYRKRTMSILESRDDVSPMQRMLTKERLSSIIRVSQELSRILDPDILLGKIVESALEVTGAQNGYIFLLNEYTGKLELKTSKNSVLQSTEELYLFEVIEHTFTSGRFFVTGNASTDAKLSQNGLVRKYALKSILCLPIATHEKRLGVLYLNNQFAAEVFSEDDYDLLSVFVTQGAISYENAAMYHELELRVQKRTEKLNRAYEAIQSAYQDLRDKESIIREDLLMAKRVQTSILPSTDSLEGFTFCTRYLPMSEVGGDFYDIAELAPGLVRVFIADATGHGVQAALVTMIIKSEYEKLKYLLSPGDVFQALNAVFTEGYSHVGIMLTAALFDIDKNQGKISYAFAGHPAQIVIDRNSVMLLKSSGRMLGALNEGRWENAEIPISKSAKMIFFTDGLYEQIDENRHEFGEGRLIEVAESAKGRPVSEIIEILTSTLDNFTAGKRINDNDDITIIGIECH